MKWMRLLRVAILASFLAHAASGRTACLAGGPDSQVVARELRSASFTGSAIGTDPVRRFAVYLPAGYEASNERYPVVYYLPTSFDDYWASFDRRGARGLLDRAIDAGVIGKFILVGVDMNTRIGASWCVNSPVTGNWEDFAVRELVPHVDASFRTLATRDSRGIVGDFMGAYGAIRLGMAHPDVFGSVYAMHPVGTGSGVQIMHARPDWDLLASARSLDDLKGNGFALIFTTIFQAHLPNTSRPPLFVDLPARKVDGKLVIDVELTDRLRNSFFIEALVPRYAANLKSLRGFKFDWARSDTNMDHIYSNHALTHKLNEFGIVHEAEEYNGTWAGRNWDEDSRIYTDVLPFFRRHLDFAATAGKGRD
ncbi:alpha/beta hydrolase [Aquisphaera giovannonii]|nr:alpha/beta hydrolase-fold protein [Aquisphaera giovannonii]